MKVISVNGIHINFQQNVVKYWLERFEGEEFEGHI